MPPSLGGATFHEDSVPPLDKGGLQGGFGPVTDNLGGLLIRNPTPALRATPPGEGIFKGETA
jgi:hypothetical protein